eukprot:scaffold311792_cov39-Tisochrysis_lutea.AAC.1
MPSFWARIWRWSKLGSGSLSKCSISTESCSLLILQRLPRVGPQSPDSEMAVSCSEVEEFHELEGEAGVCSGGGSSSSGVA